MKASRGVYVDFTGRTNASERLRPRPRTYPDYSVSDSTCLQSPGYQTTVALLRSDVLSRSVRSVQLMTGAEGTIYISLNFELYAVFLLLQQATWA